jgi:hypothetical protein
MTLSERITARRIQQLTTAREQLNNQDSRNTYQDSITGIWYVRIMQVNDFAWMSEEYVDTMLARLTAE